MLTYSQKTFNNLDAKIVLISKLDLPFFFDFRIKSS
jgi:hypothetical protein